MKNGNIKNLVKELLSDNWYTLNKYKFDYQREDNIWEKQEREVYDCGDAAAILLYNKEHKTVILTKQFRMPVYANSAEKAFMVEVCAGLLDGDSPEVCAKKEALEETGYQLEEVNSVFSAFMVPGAVTQKVHFFTAAYTATMRVNEGGGAEYETENIEVLELTFDKALEMVRTGEICDAKSILLLQYAQIQGLVS